MATFPPRRYGDHAVDGVRAAAVECKQRALAVAHDEQFRRPLAAQPGKRGFHFLFRPSDIHVVLTAPGPGHFDIGDQIALSFEKRCQVRNQPCGQAALAMHDDDADPVLRRLSRDRLQTDREDDGNAERNMAEQFLQHCQSQRRRARTGLSVGHYTDRVLASRDGHRGHAKLWRGIVCKSAAARRDSAR